MIELKNQNEKSKTKRNDYLIVREIKSDSLLSNNKYGSPVKQFIERGESHDWSNHEVGEENLNPTWKRGTKQDERRSKVEIRTNKSTHRSDHVLIISPSKEACLVQRRSPASPNQRERCNFKERMCWTEAMWQCSQAKHMDRHSVVYKKTKEPTGQWRRGKIQRARPTQEQHTYMRKQTP